MNRSNLKTAPLLVLLALGCRKIFHLWRYDIDVHRNLEAWYLVSWERFLHRPNTLIFKSSVEKLVKNYAAQPYLHYYDLEKLQQM